MSDPTPDSRPTGPLGRLRSLQGRSKLLIVVGLILAIVVITQSCQGVDVTQDQAVAAARNALAAQPGAFEPARTEAKVLRQGFPPDPYWVVVFTVPDPEGDNEDFLHHAAVWVDARSGEVHQVNVSEPDDG